MKFYILTFTATMIIIAAGFAAMAYAQGEGDLGANYTNVIMTALVMGGICNAVTFIAAIVFTLSLKDLEAKSK